MDTLTYTQVRSNFTKTMNKVCDDHEPIIITRQSEKPVVMMSLEDYNAIQETIYLLRSPKNASRIFKAIQDLQQEKLVTKELLD